MMRGTTWIENRPGARTVGDILTELWAERPLVASLAQRDIRVRSRQSFLGLFWLIAQPLVTALLFLAFFNGLAGIEAGESPYLLFTFIGTAVWAYLNSTVTQAAGSIIYHTGLVGKVYFSRLSLPASACVTGLFGLGVSFVVVAILLAIYRWWSSWPILTVPLWLAALVGLTFAIGSSLAALNVRARDVGRATSFGIQLWLWLSPVAYPTSLIEDKWGEAAAAVTFVNPVVGILEGLRWAILGSPLTWRTAISIGMVGPMLFGSLVLFARLERGTADYL